MAKKTGPGPKKTQLDKVAPKYTSALDNVSQALQSKKTGYTVSKKDMDIVNSQVKKDSTILSNLGFNKSLSKMHRERADKFFGTKFSSKNSYDSAKSEASAELYKAKEHYYGVSGKKLNTLTAEKDKKGNWTKRYER